MMTARRATATRGRSLVEMKKLASEPEMGKLYAGSMIPRVESEGMLFRKPVSTWIML
jgi:hypothetical protein